VRALVIDRNVARLGAARLVSALTPGGAARIGPLSQATIDDPEQPPGDWHRIRTRLAGICGSDLALVEGHASSYFDDWVSFPFVPGHEVVGEREDGTRVLLEPVLGHAARGLPPGDLDDYAHLVTGTLEPGIQTGFCCSTGGGWAPWFWAHDSQLHAVPDEMSDERAVLVEPFAGGIHAALLATTHVSGVDRPIIAVLGAGTMGLAAVAGLRRHLPGARIVVGARYPHQRSLAADFGADVVVEPDQLPRAVRRMAGCHIVGDHLSSGAHATVDAVGTSVSITDCLRITRPRGRVVLLGMPADVSLDLTGLWHREVELRGAYTYGSETLPDGTDTTTFAIALDAVGEVGAERLLSATYSLDEHVDAIAHAAEAGPRGAVKIAFDLRKS
jgi:threonine dehydrogenase-like Zn-dependent dehydrogenase